MRLTMSADTVTLDRFDYDQLTSFTGLTYVLLDRLEAVLPLLDENCEQRASVERAIAIARKALRGDAATPLKRLRDTVLRYDNPTGPVWPLDDKE
jgi:hypothetical protein